MLQFCANLHATVTVASISGINYKCNVFPLQLTYSELGLHASATQKRGIMAKTGNVIFNPTSLYMYYPLKAACVDVVLCSVVPPLHI